MEREAKSQEEGGEEGFVRELVIAGKTLAIQQQLVGDVNAVLWDAALVAAHWLAKQPELCAGKTVVELGAGTGAAGLAAAATGARRVILTDLPDRLELLHRNARRNREELKECDVEVEEWEWSRENKTLQEQADVLLAVDCIYYSASVPSLVNVFRSSSAPTLICIHEKREIGEPQKAQRLFQELIQEHFDVCAVPEEDLDDIYRTEDIVVNLFKRKC